MLLQHRRGHQRDKIQSFRFVSVELCHANQQVRPREAGAFSDLLVAAHDWVFDVDRVVVHTAERDDFIKGANHVHRHVLLGFLCVSSWAAVVERRRGRNCASDLVDTAAGAERSRCRWHCTARLRVHLIVVQLSSLACDRRVSLVQERARLRAFSSSQEAEVAGSSPGLGGWRTCHELGCEVIVVVGLVAVDGEVAAGVVGWLDLEGVEELQNFNEKFRIF